MSFANESNPSAGRNRKSFSRKVKHALKVDMTPMVDLGFLLISFFVISTQLSQPKALDLYMPTDGPLTPVKRSEVLTLLLDEDNLIYYYHGDWDSAVTNNSIYQTNYSGKSGLRVIIEEKQKLLDFNRSNIEGRDGLMLLIKPASGSTYMNIVDVLDEVTISLVKKYAILPLSIEERTWLEKRSLKPL